MKLTRSLVGIVLATLVVFGSGCSFNARLGGSPASYGYDSGGGPYGYGTGGGHYGYNTGGVGYPVIVPLSSQTNFQAQTMQRYGFGGNSSSQNPNPQLNSGNSGSLIGNIYGYRVR